MHSWSSLLCTLVTQQPRIVLVVKLHFLFQNPIAHGSAAFISAIFFQNISSDVDLLVVKKKRKGISIMPILKALISELCRMVRTAVWTSLFCSILFGAKPGVGNSFDIVQEMADLNQVTCNSTVKLNPYYYSDKLSYAAPFSFPELWYFDLNTTVLRSLRMTVDGESLEITVDD